MCDKNNLYLENRQINVEFDIEQDLAWVFDNDLISNLLNDIFVNAMRYCQNNIYVSAFKNEGLLTIKIEDDGDGYPESMLQKTNDAPAEIDLNLSRTGLGIYFAQLIANAHEQSGRHGDIKLENGGRFDGSVFTLTLP